MSLTGGIIFGPFNGFLVLVTASSVALFVGHIIANLALPSIFAIKETYACLFISLLPVLLGIWYTIYPFPYPIVIGPLIVLAVILFTLYRIGSTPSSILERAGQFNAQENDDELSNYQDPTPI